MKECPSCRRCYLDFVTHCPGDGSATNATLAGEPTIDGRYLLEKRLGSGRRSIIYQAHHIVQRTKHALKVILPDIEHDPQLLVRFRREALPLTKIRHQNLAAVTDFGLLQGTMPFLVMELVEGRTLRDIMRESGVPPPAKAMEIIYAVCAGLIAAHRRNVVHLDLNPRKIMLWETLPPAEAVRILGIGLTTIETPEASSSPAAPESYEVIQAFYRAPEQWSDEEPDARADIYSLGVILYQMLSGDVPFTNPDISELRQQVLSAAPPAFQSRGIVVPQEIEAVVRHALEKEPASRPQSVEAFLSELRNAVAQLAAREAEARRAEEERRERARREQEERDRIAREELERAQAEARRKVEEERQRIEAEARRKAEEEAARLRAEEEARRKAEEEERRRAEEEARRLAEEEERRVAEQEEESRKAAEALRLAVEEEARQKAEEEEKRKARLEAEYLEIHKDSGAKTASFEPTDSEIDELLEGLDDGARQKAAGIESSVMQAEPLSPRPLEEEDAQSAPVLFDTREREDEKNALPPEEVVEARAEEPLPPVVSGEARPSTELSSTQLVPTLGDEAQRVSNNYEAEPAAGPQQQPESQMARTMPSGEEGPPEVKMETRPQAGSPIHGPKLLLVLVAGLLLLSFIAIGFLIWYLLRR